MQYLITTDVASVIKITEPLINNLLDLNESFNVGMIWFGFSVFLTIKFDMTGQYEEYDDDITALVYVAESYLHPMVNRELLEATFNNLYNHHQDVIIYTLQEIINSKKTVVGIESYWPEPLILNTPRLVVNTI